MQRLVQVILVAVALQGGCAQLHPRVPPALAEAQRRAAAAAWTDGAGSSVTTAGASRGGVGQQQQQQQQQVGPASREPPRLPALLQQRHLLASKDSGGKDAGGGAPDGPRAQAAVAFANLTVGNITGAREMALRKALLQDYDKLSFPWVRRNLPTGLAARGGCQGWLQRVAVWRWRRGGQAVVLLCGAVPAGAANPA